MTYYIIWQGINKMYPILPYITWGLVWDPQNKRGIPDKNIIGPRNKRGIPERNILILFIIEENKKEEDI